MGLLKNSPNLQRDLVDCVGKVGYCDCVTDPNSNQTFMQTTLFKDNSKMVDDLQINHVRSNISKILNSENIEDSAIDYHVNERGDYKVNEDRKQDRDELTFEKDQIIIDALRTILEIVVRIEEKLS